MTWWLDDLRIIILMFVSEVRVGKIFIQNLFLIHDFTFNSNDLRYLSCHSDFSSSRSIKSGQDDNFIPDVCPNIIFDGNFTFSIMFYCWSRFWSITYAIRRRQYSFIHLFIHLFIHSFIHSCWHARCEQEFHQRNCLQ
jgi:hypothetical protein